MDQAIVIVSSLCYDINVNQERKVSMEDFSKKLGASFAYFIVALMIVVIAVVTWKFLDWFINL